MSTIINKWHEFLDLVEEAIQTCPATQNNKDSDMIAVLASVKRDAEKVLSDLLVTDARKDWKERPQQG